MMPATTAYPCPALSREEALLFLDRAMSFVEALSDIGFCIPQIAETPEGLIHDLAARISSGNVNNVAHDLHREMKRTAP